MWLCHPSWCFCWSPLSPVKHACICITVYFWFPQLLHYVFFLTHHTSWHLHKPESYRTKCCCIPSPLPRFSWSGLGRACPGWAVRPRAGCCCVTVTVSPPVITTSALTRVARPRRNIAHIVLPLFCRRDMKIINYWATATALQQQY